MFEPSLKKKGDLITISFIRREALQEDIQRIMQTSRINKHMFEDTGYGWVSFREFFALEFYFILDELIAYPKYRLMSVRSLKQIQTILKEETWLSKIDLTHPSRLNYSNLNRLHFTPLDYQETFIRHYDKTLTAYNLNGLLLAAAPGTGKTFTSLAIAECLDASKIVVVCPKPAVYRVWKTSVVNKQDEGGLFKKPPTCWVKDENKPYNNERVLIYHYEALQHALDMVKYFKGPNTVVILDESHNLNEMVSLRTQKFIDLTAQIGSKDVIFATGTPIKALSVETIPLLKAIDPLFTDQVLIAFKKMYAGEIQSTTKILARRYGIVSYKVEKKAIKLADPLEESIKIKIPNGKDYTLDTIQKEMTAFTIKRIAELQKDYPEVEKFYYGILREHYNNLRGKGPIAAYREYERCLKQIIKHYKSDSLYLVGDEMKYCSGYEKNKILPEIPDRATKDRFIFAKTLVKYLKLKVQGECLGRILGRKRIDAYKDLVAHIPFDKYIESTEKKTVIFTTYAEVIEVTLASLKKLEYKPLAVYGQFTKNLSSIVNDFEKKEELNPLVATYASLSTAVPLIMADTMVIINPPYRQYIMDQTIARIHRLGTTTQTRIFNIILDTGEEPNISTRTLDIMQWSKDQIDAILGIKTLNVIDEDTDETSKDLSIESVIPMYRESGNYNRPLFAEW